MNLKHWPNNYVALVSCRLNDPYLRPCKNSETCQCWNCEEKIRVGPRNFQYYRLNPTNTLLLCVQCYKTYMDRASHTILTLIPMEQPSVLTN